MIYHQFDPVTGEHVSERVPAVDPLETKAAGHVVYALPGINETTTAPPAVSAGNVAVFAAGTWTIHPDYRGETWYAADGSPSVVVQIGEPVSLQRDQPPAFLARLKAERTAAAWTEGERRLVDYVVTVPISGVSQLFGCDTVTRENIIGVNALIDKERGGLLPAGTIPNPRPWTPKGSLSPVSVTHQEFALIGAALAAAKESHYQAYATHKAAISALTTKAAVEDYDISTGWPT